MQNIAGWKDRILFTPGPLTTSRPVKQAMLRDLGSRDYEFIEVIRDIRNTLVLLGEAQPGEYEAVPMQGSGTFSVEAVFSSAVPRDGKVMIIVNGAYGRRMAKICDVLGIDHVDIECAENVLPDTEVITKTLEQQAGVIDMVAIVHCETTTGIINPIQKIGRLAQQAGARYYVDAMSSFGAVPVNLRACHIDFLVSSSNKCIEGVPGFGFVIARKEALLECEGRARSLSLDILDQWRGFEKNGQFRFTPPTHGMLAFHQALRELQQEGGPKARGERYYRNYEILVEGMRGMGFREYLEPAIQGYIITSFLYPDHPNWDFDTFYRKLNERDFVIYPGKVSNADCFRIGNIGRIFPPDVRNLLAAIRDVMVEMDVVLT
jgi:2-aminoethylphosphonate-pyruvate transaminase